MRQFEEDTWNAKNYQRLVFKIDFWNHKSKTKRKQQSRKIGKDPKR